MRVRACVCAGYVVIVCPLRWRSRLTGKFFASYELAEVRLRPDGAEQRSLMYACETENDRPALQESLKKDGGLRA